MNKYILTLIASTFALPSFVNGQQVIDGSGGPITVNIDSTGQKDGVSFINQTGPNECTLQVSADNEINKKKKTNGITTDAPNLGSVIFSAGSSKSTSVHGNLGSSTNPLNTFFINGAVEFDDTIYVENVTFGGSGGGNMSLKGTLNVGSGNVNFPVTGVLSLDSNAVINGNVGNSLSTGLLYIGSESAINGNVIVNSITISTGNSTDPNKKIGYVNGNGAFQNITTNNASVFILGGDLALNDGFRIIGDEAFGYAFPIFVTGNTTFTGLGGEIQYVFGTDKAPPPLTGGNSIVIGILSSASGDSFGGTFQASTNDGRIPAWYGVMSNGTIQIISGVPGTPGTPPPVVPDTPNPPWWLPSLEGNADASNEVMLNLLPLADSYRGTDLDFIQGQLQPVNMEAYGQTVYQLYPAPALIGLAPETFHVSKQFQKVWLERLNRSRTLCNFQADPCCGDMRDFTRVWLDGFGYHGRQSNNNHGKGYTVTSSGTTIGVEKSITDELTMGVGFGYGYSVLRKSQFVIQSARTNRTKFNSYEGTLYYSYNPNPWFMDCGLSLGWNRYQGARYIAFRTVDRKASSRYSGQNYSTFLTTGYQYVCNNLQITPMASLMYYYLHMNDYKEKGAKCLNLKVNSQNYRFLESGLGLKAAYLWSTCYGSFIPEIHTFWYHDFNQNRVNVRASFSQQAAWAGYFKSIGPHVDRDLWNIGGSITCVGNNDLSLLLNYDFEASNNYFDNQGMIELSYVF